MRDIASGVVYVFSIWAEHSLPAGLWKPAAGKDEIERRNDISTIQRVFPRPMTVFVTQPLGGAGKTMVSVGIGSTFGIHSTLDTLVWDNNETMGSLGIRTSSNGSRTTVCGWWPSLSEAVIRH